MVQTAVCVLDESYRCVFVWLQVQLLISSQDVENYKLIKADLDRLRTLVEKSELWVEKKNSSGGDGKKEKEEVGNCLSEVHSFTNR